MTSPVLVVHADWSVHPEKRWMAWAVRWRDGYLASSPQPVGTIATFWARLVAAARGGPILVGFDFPIGLPAAYARRADIADFVLALVGFGADQWRDFYSVASAPEEISLIRPFYPRRPGGRRREHLWQALELDGWDDLHRRCDRRTTSRLAACPMFWTLGGNQVGRAAITGWRDLLAPARRERVDVAIWPFDGPLFELLGRRRFVVTETYPGEVYGHLGLELRAHGGKRRQAARIASAASLLAWAERADVALAPELCADIEDGFGPDANADDCFDAVIGLFGMLNVVRGARPTGDPDHPAVQRIEGWILGLDPAELTTAGERSN
jgi:hypothetical protein